MTTAQKTLTADEALEIVGPGMTVAAASLSAEPVALLAALGRRMSEVAPVTLVSGMLLDGYQALSPHLGHDLRLTTWFMPQTLLGDVGLGPHVDFLPMSWVQTYRHVAEQSFDVCLIQVSPADEDGYHSVGISSSLTKLLAQRSRVVIAQVNREMPFTLGDTRLHASQIDVAVEQDAPLRAFPHRAPDERSVRIAEHIASLIDDGTTVQAGIGVVPEAVLRILAAAGRRDLQITSMLTDAGRELIESGATTADGPAAVVGEVCGTAELYRWVERNPQVELRPGLDTHSLEAISRRGPFVSINSTLEVDLYGQLNSEVVSSGQAGGIGGSVDFMMAAQLAGNRSVVALPSTTKRGASRIVPVITRGLVTVPRTLVQFVVTEHGVADLRSKTAAERAEALVAVAHPDHRDELRAATATL